MPAGTTLRSTAPTAHLTLTPDTTLTSGPLKATLPTR